MKLIDEIEKLKKSPVKKVVYSRIKEFKSIGKSGNDTLFKELCFCILTANSTAEQCINVHGKVCDGFLFLNESKLQKRLKELGCRFHTKRASYITYSRKFKDELRTVLDNSSPIEARDWLAANIKGIGLKEASHFLRNIGYSDLAIIDFHIVDILVSNKLIKKPKVLNRLNYLEIEDKLRLLAKNLKLTLAELDFYLWYLETGKVLK